MQMKKLSWVAQKDFDFLEEISHAVLHASLVHPGEIIGSEAPNTLGATVIRPGGGACYPAFWTRDFIMSADSGVVENELLLPMFDILSQYQSPKNWKPTPGAEIPRGVIPDHIRFHGEALFYPGCWKTEEQNGTFGYYPPYDDHFFYIHLAWLLVKNQLVRDPAKWLCAGRPAFERLEEAFSVTPVDRETQMAVNDDDRWGISFGFPDTVKHTGKLLFASLLRFRAAEELAELFNLAGNHSRSEYYSSVARLMKNCFASVFAAPNGFWRASSRMSSQCDVWGSAFAVNIQAADDAEAERISRTLTQAYHAGTLACRGAIRHVPVGMEATTDNCWEGNFCNYPLNTYQHGAYWSTPTGWVARAIARTEPETAARLIHELVADLQANDFRNMPQQIGAPYECFHDETDHRQNPVYLTSVTAVLAALRELP